MDQTKCIATSFDIDIAEYLLLVCDYGKPNFKYFNFLWNKMGFQFLFFYKDKMFSYKNNVFEFCELCLESLKKIFLNDKSVLKRSAIIYLFCKLYFTDKTISLLKLRVTNEEFIEFKAFVEIISKVPAYQTVQIMFWQLFVENFFRFCIKSTILALDFGKVDQLVEDEKQSIESAQFWNDIKKELDNLNAREVEELKVLNKIHTEVIKTFDNILPESDNLNKALQEFEELKNMVASSTVFIPKIAKHRLRTNQQYKEFLQRKPDKNNKDADSDDSLIEQPLSKRKKRKCKKSAPIYSDSDSSDSSDDSTFNRQRSDFNSHNISKAFGETSGDHREKINECYK